MKNRLLKYLLYILVGLTGSILLRFLTVGLFFQYATQLIIVNSALITWISITYRQLRLWVIFILLFYAIESLFFGITVEWRANSNFLEATITLFFAGLVVLNKKQIALLMVLPLILLTFLIDIYSSVYLPLSKNTTEVKANSKLNTKNLKLVRSSVPAFQNKERIYFFYFSSCGSCFQLAKWLLEYVPEHKLILVDDGSIDSYHKCLTSRESFYLKAPLAYDSAGIFTKSCHVQVSPTLIITDSTGSPRIFQTGTGSIGRPMGSFFEKRIINSVWSEKL